MNIAVLTSGGDAPGMNAVIRAVVRMSLYRGCQPYLVREGFKGLIEGLIAPCGWNDVGHVLGEGGTMIKSSRCPAFMTREGRREAALNLAKRGIDRLVVIGGDGSLTGANILRAEWPELLAELKAQGYEIPASLGEFKIAGVVGSIDNDMVGTDFTIGAISSLHRIIECLDSISSTAASHQRAFVIEVMGRHCGWLALNACIASGADWLLVPEDPPVEGWEQSMIRCLERNRGSGKTTTIVIVAEGAIDRQGNPIKSDYVRQVLEDSGLDARLTTLGHLQRGGAPAAFDRYLGTLQGIEAVEALLDPSVTDSVMIGISEHRITRRSLVESVEQTRAVSEAMKALRFGTAFDLRDPDFKANYAMWEMLRMFESADTAPSTPLNIAIVNCGAPCGGVNAANRAIVHYCRYKGYKALGILNGFRGLMAGEVKPLDWMDVDGWIARGGSMLGMNRTLPDKDVGLVAYQLQKHCIDGLIIIGGFEAYSALLSLSRARGEYPALDIPLCCLPATISNNVPGTEISIGSDTALNIINGACDSIKVSASSSRKRLFIVDVQGGHCGYLATMSALGSGATYAYIAEEGVKLCDLSREASHLRQRFKEDRLTGRLILRNEKCSDIYSPSLMASIFESESEGVFDARWLSLGHLQQGGSPSPLDRVMATRLAILCVHFIEGWLGIPEDPHRLERLGADSISSVSSLAASPLDSPRSMPRRIVNPASSVVIGIKGPRVIFTPGEELVDETDFIHRRPRLQWWMHLRRIMRILAKYPDVEQEVLPTDSI